jgi:hypothetical protein
MRPLRRLCLLLARPERELREILRVPKPEGGSPRDGGSACAQPIAPQGFTVYT